MTTAGCTDFLVSSIPVSSINLCYLIHKTLFILLFIVCAKFPTVIKLWRHCSTMEKWRIDPTIRQLRTNESMPTIPCTSPILCKTFIKFRQLFFNLRVSTKYTHIFQNSCFADQKYSVFKNNNDGKQLSSVFLAKKTTVKVHWLLLPMVQKDF